ncbi:MAG: adenylate/guanylate cyclase domain-containing protein [Desulfosarcina sp.]|nr:adenylate/guanylate cyclase domain-containing protein [Desulfobacterales bacterium]
MERLLRALFFGIATGLLGLCLTPLFFSLEENIGLEYLFSIRGKRYAPRDVIIISIDKNSAKKLNLPNDLEKWPRSLHAGLVDILTQKGAALIAFDVLFDEPRSPVDDNLFADSIKNANNVLLFESLDKETVPLTSEQGAYSGQLHAVTRNPPIPLFAKSAVAVASFVLPKVPVKVSQYWTFQTNAGGLPTLPMVALQVYALEFYDEFTHLLKKIDPAQGEKIRFHNQTALINDNALCKHIRAIRDIFQKDPSIANKMLAELRNSNLLSGEVKKKQVIKALIKNYQDPPSHFINFYGPPGSIPTISYSKVIAANQKKVIFKDKAVFVGVSEYLRPEQEDGFYTVFSQASGVDISGVEIAATAFANMLEDMHIKPLNLLYHLSFIFLGGMLLGFLSFYFSTFAAVISIILLSTLYLFFAQYQFNNFGNWYPLVIPLFFLSPVTIFSAFIRKYLEAHRERKNIKKAFGYYLPSRIVDQLVANKSEIIKTGEMVSGICLCTDAGQYTTLSESMKPDELGSYMNEYYETIFEPVVKSGGLISNIVGDAMLSIWADTDLEPALMNRACHTALDIVRNVNRFNNESTRLKLPIRIGLHSGQMMLGNIGAIDHYEYRPVGDVINSASRLEGLNKYMGTEILASAESLYQVDDFLVRNLGEFLVVGKSKPIMVYELICRKGDASKQQKELCTIFDEALNFYRNQSWNQAIAQFHNTAKIFGEDGPSRFYRILCEKYKKNSPGETWTGLVCLNSK